MTLRRDAPAPPRGTLAGPFEPRRESRYERSVANDGKSPRRGGVEAPYRPEETPISSSAIVIRRSASPEAQQRRRRDADLALTPYQARLDVEMDDTAVSKVRDPSVSISLAADGLLGEGPRSSRRRAPSAVASVLIGTAIGAFVVVAVVSAARALFN